MTNEKREEKINRKKIQSVTTNEIREEKITRKKIQSDNPTQPNPKMFGFMNFYIQFGL